MLINRPWCELVGDKDLADRATRNRRLLITGCPRSGTKYAAHLLTQLGCDVKHEAFGTDGISSWCMAVEADEAPWGPARQQRHRFEVVLHQVRNPAFVIPSMTTLNDKTWNFVYKYTPCRSSEPVLLRSAKFWYHWNLHAEKIAHWRYRLEDLESSFPEFCVKASVRVDRDVLHRVGTNINSRAYRGFPALFKWFCDRLHHEPPALLRRRFVDRTVYAGEHRFDWRLVRELDREVFEQVIGLAKAYGYSYSELGCEAVV